MTWFFVMLALWFVMVRRRRRRWALGHARRMELDWGPGREERWQRRQRRRTRERTPTLPPPESRLDALKRRFVSGELSDEQYEREVDALLRSPGGMAEL
jgi:hypothetical protein